MDTRLARIERVPVTKLGGDNVWNLGSFVLLAEGSQMKILSSLTPKEANTWACSTTYTPSAGASRRPLF